MRRPAILLALALTAAAPPPPRDPALNARVFERAWSLVGKRYWDPELHGLDWDAEHDRYYASALAAPDGRRFYAVLNMMLADLGDSHVYATSPERLADSRARRSSGEAGGEESGFGFDAFLDRGAWRIRAVRKDGPAARAGMQIGWTLLAVDGGPVDIDRHYGEGERAALLLADEYGARHSLSLTGQALLSEPQWRATWLDGDILLLAFDGFDDGVDRWIARQLSGTRRPAAVVLDLRENEGGEAGILDRIAGRFVSERRVVVQVIAARTTQEKTRGGNAHAYAGPLAVLIGPRTASAAEALAAFLDEAGRAVTVGEPTSGALTGGVEHRLPDGGQLTIAEYDIRTPSGRRLEGRGFTPRYRVTPTLAEERAGEDPALRRAIALIAPGPGGEKIAGAGITR